MEKEVKTTVEKNEKKESVKKLMAGRNLSWDQVQKLPKVVCQIEKRTSKSGVAIYTLKTIIRQNIIFKDNIFLDFFNDILTFPFFISPGNCSNIILPLVSFFFSE